MSCCKAQTISPPCTTANCIKAGTHIVHPKDGVAPCGEEGTIDLAALNITNRTTCGEDLIYGLAEWDHAGFEIATLSGTTITYVTSEGAVPGMLYKIRFTVRCAIKGLSDIGDIFVGIKDICVNLQCGPGEVCHKCRGCEEAGLDVST